MKKISCLEDHIGYWMRYVSNHVSVSFQKKLEEFDIGVADWVVLRLLFDTPILSPGIIAERIGMTRGAVSKLLDRLFYKKFIERIESSEDRRFQHIQLTEKGKKLLPILADLADGNDAQFFGHLSTAQKKHLLKLLKEIATHHQWNQIPIN